MDAHKRYTIRVVCLVVAPMLVLLATGLYLQPLAGDETRVGSFAENDFGWNRPQKVFPGDGPPLRQDYDQYSDVLVVGDSFSFAGNYGLLNYPWQTFLTAKTGLSVATINHYMKTKLIYDSELLPKIVNSEAFQKTPPRILIMEAVERQLDILPDIAGDCQVRPDPETSFSLNPLPQPLPSAEAVRKKTQPPLTERMAYAKKYLMRLAPWPWDDNPITRWSLTTGALFSSKKSGEVLITAAELKKKSWDEAKLAGIRCQLANMQNLVQKNGKTLFVAMLVPDKLTAYSRYLQDRSLADLSVIERVASNPSLHVVRIDRAIKAAVDAGEVDVYLPNDTHWAYRGDEIAAEALAQYLKGFPGS
jgi:hypothetical protein